MLKYSIRNFGCALLTLPLAVVLTGCPDSQNVASDAGPSKAALAPAVDPASVVPKIAPSPAPTGEQIRAQQLIVRVQRTFSSGEAHYRKGELMQAKADFDSAVDQMMASGIDIKSDPLLQEEFERILDAVNALEMEALKRGNGFAPNVEPTPADVAANDVTFNVDPNVVAKAKEQLATTKSDLPLVINDYVAGFINFFANTQRGHNTLMHSFERSGRYKAMIQRVMTEEGVPQDLIYLAVAESSFQPQAVNGHSGAGGMWQFMPHGDYGLTRNGYVDERFDPEKSTRAYARYMKFNYNQLGDWYLAMAAYNWGAGNVQRAVQKTGYADFWELYKRNNLPGETKNYVPEILAAIIIARNPTQYGFDTIPLDPPILSDIVPIDYSVDLRLVADVVDAQPQDILALNPSLLRLTTPPAGTMPGTPGTFDLHVPVGKGDIYKQRIAEIPEDRRTLWRYHRVAADETLDSVARSFHVTTDQLASANELKADHALSGVDALVIPVPHSTAAASHVEYYKARKGDTMVTIADRFGVSLDDLHRWNRLSNANAVAGQRIRVTEPARLAPHTSERKSATHAAAGKQAKANSSRSSASGGTTKHTAKKQEAASTKGKAKASFSKQTSSSNKAESSTKSKHKKNIQK